MVDSRFVPRYFEIEQALRGRIGGLHPGDPLPSDAMLCREFGVSRMTARNAVQRLVEDGLVQRVPGLGTFVAEPAQHRQASSLLSFSDEMRQLGRSPSSRVLRRRVRPADEREARRLKLGSGAEVVVLERLRLADDLPVARETARLPTRLREIVESADLEHTSLHATFVAHDVVPVSGYATINARSATARDAKLLSVARGSPLLVEERLIVDQAGRPIELTESRYAAERYGLDVRFDVQRPASG